MGACNPRIRSHNEFANELKARTYICVGYSDNREIVSSSKVWTFNLSAARSPSLPLEHNVPDYLYFFSWFVIISYNNRVAKIYIPRHLYIDILEYFWEFGYEKENDNKDLNENCKHSRLCFGRE